MIERKVFTKVWGTLCERFRVVMDDATVVNEYYVQLSAEMTTDEFVYAARRVFRDREFFPRPLDFLSAVSEREERASLSEWKIVHRVMTGDEEAYRELSDHGREVVSLLGGVKAIGGASPSSMPHVRREFRSLYEQIAKYDREERRDAMLREDSTARLADPNDGRTLTP